MRCQTSAHAPPVAFPGSSFTALHHFQSRHGNLPYTPGYSATARHLCQAASSLHPVVLQVFAGSFRGKVLFENPEFINPNAVRAHEKRKAAGAYDQKQERRAASKAHREAHHVGEDPMSNKVVFAAADGGGGSGSDGEAAEGIDFGGGGDGSGPSDSADE